MCCIVNCDYSYGSNAKASQSVIITEFSYTYVFCPQNKSSV